MTKEQTALVESNHNLIWGFLHKHGLSEDFYGDAAIGLCQAAEGYDIVYGTAFSTYAYRCMYNECAKTWRKEDRQGHPLVVSLNDVVFRVDESDFTREASLPSKEGSEYMEAASNVSQFLDKMCIRDLKILLYRLQGLKYREIGEKLGLSHEYTRQLAKKIGKSYKEDTRTKEKAANENPQEQAALIKEIMEYLRS